MTLLTKKKRASSGLKLILFLMRKQNWPTVRSEGTRYFFLSRSPILAFGDFSTMTGTLSGYFLLIFSPSALLFSKGCSSLYCHFMVLALGGFWLARAKYFSSYNEGHHAEHGYCG